LQKTRLATITPIAPSLQFFSSSSSALDNTDTFEGALSATCIGLPSQIITTFLEVELVDNKVEFTNNLAQALTSALSHKYTTCLSLQYPEDNFDPSHARRLEFDDNEVLLGTIDVDETKLGCSAQSGLSNSCQIANATIFLFGKKDANETIHPLLHSITTDSGSFHEEVMSNGIVSVRLQDNQGNTEAFNSPFQVDRVQDNQGDTETPNPSSQVGPTSNSSSSKIIVIVILSLVAVILVAITMFALRNTSFCCHKNSEEAYIPSRKMPSWVEHHQINISFDQEDRADNDSDSDRNSDNETYAPTIPISAAYI